MNMPAAVAGVCLWAVCAAGGPIPGLGADEPPRPLDVLREAIEPARAIDDPARRDAVLSDLAEALTMLGSVPDALTVKDAIASPVVQAGVVQTIVYVQTEAGDVAGEVRSAEALNTQEAENAGYKTTAVKRISEALARAGDWDGAARKARSCDPMIRATLIADVIANRARAGDVDGAIRQAERLENTSDPRFRTGTPLPLPRRVAIVTLVGVLAEKNERDCTERLLAAHPDAMDEGLAAIARGRFKARDMDGAAAAARRLVDRGGDLHSEAIARAGADPRLIAQGRLDEAARLADGAWLVPKATRLDLASAEHVERMQNWARFAVARARADRGDAGAAVAALAGMPSAVSRAFDLLELARARLDKGDRKSAETLVNAALAALEGPTGSEYYLAWIGELMVRYGEIEPRTGSSGERYLLATSDRPSIALMRPSARRREATSRAPSSRSRPYRRPRPAPGPGSGWPFSRRERAGVTRPSTPLH